MNTPLISVITPSLNSAAYIRDAIESVLRQGYPNFEHIVADGGSTDGTTEVLNNYPHLRWISEPDNGQSDAMNKGFAMSKGDIIVYLNSDDYFEPEAFNSVVPYFLRGEKFVVGNVRVLNENGTFWINTPSVDFSTMLRWWKFNAFCHNPGGYFFLREVLDTVGPFNTANHYNMDWDFLLKSALHYRFYKIDALLATYRRFDFTKSKENVRFKMNSYVFSKTYWKHLPAFEHFKIFIEFNYIDIIRFNRLIGKAANLVYALKFKIINTAEFIQRFLVLRFAKTIAIFGACPEGVMYLQKCRKKGMDVKFFIDISVKANSFNGLPLHDINDFIGGDFGDIEAILVAESLRKNKIKRMLDSVGFKKPVV
ncbi:MAG: glycosyltransferase [Nitrospirae bacterium YQR-1]